MHFPCYQEMNTNLVAKGSTFLPSLAWQLTFNGVSRAIIFSSLPLLTHTKKVLAISNLYQILSEDIYVNIQKH